MIPYVFIWLISIATESTSPGAAGCVSVPTLYKYNGTAYWNPSISASSSNLRRALTSSRIGIKDDLPLSNPGTLL